MSGGRPTGPFATANAAPATGPVMRRLLWPGFVAGALLVTTVPTLIARLLDLTAEQERFARGAFAIGTAGVLALITIGLLLGLRGIAGAAPDDAIARRRVLRLPLRLAGAVAVFGAGTTLAAVLVRFMTSADPPSLIFGVGLVSAALCGFLAVPAFSFSRAAVLPYALYFARESLPEGRRLPVGLIAGYTVLSVAALALAPAAVVGNARLYAAREKAANERALASARRIGKILEGRSRSEAVHLVSRMHLDGLIILLRMPTGEVLPEEAALEAGDAPREEAVLGGELAGGGVQAIARPRRPSQSVLLFVVLALIGVATLIAVSLGRAMTRDARGVTRQVEALAVDQPPPPVTTVSTSEVRRVALAVNRLLDRIPRLQLEKFLAIERADESRRLKSMFLANMSHDLRSPLNSILGFTELLMRGLEGPVTDTQRTTLEDINETGHHLLRLLSEILDTARAESGHLDLQRAATSPATFVTQAHKDALRGRPERVTELLDIDMQAGLQAVHCDALRIQQALTHVLDWAIDAAQGRPVRVEIGDRDRETGRAFVIEVCCVGCSTTAEEEAMLFQPFRKVPGVPGLHLALPLARRIVEAHRGILEPYGDPDVHLGTGEHRLGVRIILPRHGRVL